MAADKRLYGIWTDMHRRCVDPRLRCYPRYGGRGIKVCDEWSEYVTFERWARSSGYCRDLTIDRIDNDGNYEPTNCRWATRKQQSRNTSSNRKIVVDGKSVTIAEAAEVAGVRDITFRGRLRRGLSIEQASKPVKARRYGIVIDGVYRSYASLAKESGLPQKLISNRVSAGWPVDRILDPMTPIGCGVARWIEFRGETHHISDWARVLGMPRAVLSKRLQYGWSVERAFTTPVRSHRLASDYRVAEVVRHG